MEGFKEGYKYFENNAGSFFSALKAEDSIDQNISHIDSHNSWVEEVNKAVDKMIKDLNDFGKKGIKTDIAQMKGDVFEYWHSDSFMYNSVSSNSDSVTYVDRSHDFASPDISSNFGMKAGLKAYYSGKASAKAQSISVFERFKEYQARGGKDSLEKYLKDRNYEDDSVLHDPIYSGQIRVIPKDQLEEAVNWLERMIKTEALRRPEQVHKLQETLELLRDKISDGKGVESVAITKKDLELITRLAKEGGITEAELEKYGITKEEILEYESVIKELLQAGVTAGIITMVLKSAPEILKAISYLIEEGKIEKEQFKKIGFNAVTGFSEGFIKGSIAATIIYYIKTGKFGKKLQKIDGIGSIVSAIVFIVYNVIKNSYLVSKKEKTRCDLVNELVRDIYISTLTIVGGQIGRLTIKIPILGCMIGSFVGTAIGYITYKAEQKAVMSFCVDSGLTMFGLVEQDYELPEDVIEQIGLDVFDYEKNEFDSFELDDFELSTFEFEKFESDEIGIRLLRRGVIEVHKIGYV